MGPTQSPKRFPVGRQQGRPASPRFPIGDPGDLERGRDQIDLCQNRLPVKYAPKAPSPERWLTFLHELLDDADIPTLQEYLG